MDTYDDEGNPLYSFGFDGERWRVFKGNDIIPKTFSSRHRCQEYIDEQTEEPPQ